MFVGQTKLSHGIECSDSSDLGVERIVSNFHGPILEVTIQDSDDAIIHNIVCYQEQK